MYAPARSGSSARPFSSATSRWPSTRPRPRPSTSTWAAATSFRRSSPRSPPRPPRSTSTSTASAPARSATHSERAARQGRRRGRDPGGRRPDRSRPGRSGGFYERLRAGGVEVCVMRARAVGAPRPPEALRRGRPRRLGRRRGDRGPLRRWSLPRPFRPPHGAGGRAAAARVPRQLPLARRRRPAGALDALFASSRRARSGDRAAQRARLVPSHHDRHRGAVRRRARHARCSEPYVADKAMIGGSRAPPAGACASGRGACAPQQPRVRCRAAPPPPRAAGRGRAHTRLPDDAARESLRPRRRGGARRHLRPRGVEPQALLRDRRVRALARVRGDLRRALPAPAEAVSSSGTRRPGSGRGSRLRRSRRSRPSSDRGRAIFRSPVAAKLPAALARDLDSLASARGRPGVS